MCACALHWVLLGAVVRALGCSRAARLLFLSLCNKQPWPGSIRVEDTLLYFTQAMTHGHGVQPGKSLYTTVRELVENALDSCEGIGQPPHVLITMCGST